MNRLLISIIILFLCTTACSQQNKSNVDSGHLNEKVKIDKYIALTNKMDSITGGFIDEPFHNQLGTMYSSFYIISSLILLDQQLINNEIVAIDKFLNSQLTSIIKQDNSSIVYDLFYYSDLKSKLKLKISDESKNEIIDVLNNLKSASGGYFYNSFDAQQNSFPEVNKIAATLYAMQIKQNLGIEIDNNIKEWSTQRLNELLETKMHVGYLSVLLGLMNQLNLEYNTAEITKVYNYDIKNILTHSNQVLELTAALELVNYLKLDFEDIDNIWEKFEDSQNSDGGWGYDFGEFTDEHATFLSVQIHNLFNLNLHKTDELKQTLIEQKSFFGGFSPMYRSNINFNSSRIIYYLNSLYNISIEKKEEFKKLVSQNLKDFKNHSSATKYSLLALCKYLNLNIDKDIYLDKDLWGLTGEFDLQNLKDGYYFSQALSEYKVLDTEFNLMTEKYLNKILLEPKLSIKEYFILQNIKNSYGEINPNDIVKVVYNNSKDISNLLEDTESLYLVYNILSDMHINNAFREEMNKALSDLENKIHSNSNQLSLFDLYYYEKIKKILAT